MTPRMPNVRVDGDVSPSLPMSRFGTLVGFSRAHFLWLFGFRPMTPLAEAFSVATDQALWVLAVREGVVLELWRCGWDERLPVRFRRVADAPL